MLPNCLLVVCSCCLCSLVAFRCICGFWGVTVPLNLHGCECRYLLNLRLDISSTSLPSLICVKLSQGSAIVGVRHYHSEALPHSSETMPHLKFNFYSSLFLNILLHWHPSWSFCNPHCNHFLASMVI